MRIRTPARPGAPTPRPASPAPAAAPAPGAVGAGWPGSELLRDPVLARTLFSVWSGDPAVVVPSPPGAGKTRLVGLLAAALAHRADLRVSISAQTRAQAVELARRLSAVLPDHGRAALIWKNNTPAPDTGGIPVVSGAAVRWPRSGGGILIATTARWLYADPATLAADVIVVDEAWQMTYADLGALGALAPQIVCVGDPGQIDPVVTGDASRWAASTTGPHLPAPVALLAAHRSAVGVVRLRHTWRLGAASTALVAPLFYPDLPFTSRRPPEHLSDRSGAVVPELAHRAVTVTAGHTDPALLGACAERARELLTATLTTGRGALPVAAADLAVVVAHVTQAAAIRALLADQPDVLVGTANTLQGLERAAVVVLHPLAGYRTAESFALDAGRACVMLSRHRAHATVVTDTATPAVLTAAEDGPRLSAGKRLMDAVLTTATV